MQLRHLLLTMVIMPNFGARPLKRYIQRTVETLAARIILEGDIDTGSVIEIDVKDGKLDAKVVK